MSYKSELAFAHEHEPVLDRVYAKLFPSATVTRYADNTPEQINNDTDLFIELKEKIIFFEEKIVRSKNYDRIYVEDSSCPATGKPGWIYTSKADFLVWCFVETSGLHRIYIINFRKLKKFFDANVNKYPTHQNEYTPNRSTGVIIPLSDIKDCIVYRGEIR